MSKTEELKKVEFANIKFPMFTKIKNPRLFKKNSGDEAIHGSVLYNEENMYAKLVHHTIEREAESYIAQTVVNEMMETCRSNDLPNFFLKTIAVVTFSGLTKEIKIKEHEIHTAHPWLWEFIHLKLKGRSKKRFNFDVEPESEEVFKWTYFLMEEVRVQRTMNSFLKQPISQVSVIEKLIVCMQVVCALKVMCTNEVTHNDMHLNNIFVVDQNIILQRGQKNLFSCKYLVKIFDWDRSICNKAQCISERYDQSKNYKMISRHISVFNEYFDLVGFVNNLHRIIKDKKYIFGFGEGSKSFYILFNVFKKLYEFQSSLEFKNAGKEQTPCYMEDVKVSIAPPYINLNDDLAETEFVDGAEQMCLYEWPAQAIKLAIGGANLHDEFIKAITIVIRNMRNQNMKNLLLIK